MQESCAAAAVVATEVLYGASPAWRDPSCLLAPEPNAEAAAAAAGSAASPAGGTSSAAPAASTNGMTRSRADKAPGGCGGSSSTGASAADAACTGCKAGPGGGGGSSTGASAADAAAAGELSRCAGLLLELLSDDRLAVLPTHAEAARHLTAPGRGGGGGGWELAAHRWTPQVRPPLQQCISHIVSQSHVKVLACQPVRALCVLELC